MLAPTLAARVSRSRVGLPSPVTLLLMFPLLFVIEGRPDRQCYVPLVRGWAFYIQLFAWPVLLMTGPAALIGVLSDQRERWAITAVLLWLPANVLVLGRGGCG